LKILSKNRNTNLFRGFNAVVTQLVFDFMYEIPCGVVDTGMVLTTRDDGHAIFECLYVNKRKVPRTVFSPLRYDARALVFPRIAIDAVFDTGLFYIITSSEVKGFFVLFLTQDAYTAIHLLGDVDVVGFSFVVSYQFHNMFFAKHASGDITMFGSFLEEKFPMAKAEFKITHIDTFSDPNTKIVSHWVSIATLLVGKTLKIFLDENGLKFQEAYVPHITDITTTETHFLHNRRYGDHAMAVCKGVSFSKVEAIHGVYILVTEDGKTYAHTHNRPFHLLSSDGETFDMFSYSNDGDETGVVLFLDRSFVHLPFFVEWADFGFEGDSISGYLEVLCKSHFPDAKVVNIDCHNPLHPLGFSAIFFPPGTLFGGHLQIITGHVSPDIDILNKFNDVEDFFILEDLPGIILIKTRDSVFPVDGYGIVDIEYWNKVPRSVKSVIDELSGGLKVGLNFMNP